MTNSPIHLQAAQLPSALYLAFAVVFFAASLIWTLRDGIKRGHILAFLALIGGAIASLEEPWIDHLIQLWYPLNSPMILFTAMGTPQPLYLHLIYPGFIGLGAYMTYLGLLRHPDGRLLWPSFIGIALMDLAFEGSATWYGIFYYYGDQPFQFFENGWPAWVAPINATGPIFGGWLMLKLEPHFRGMRRPLFALLPPFAYTATYGAAGWPTATLMNSDAAEIWVWVAATITMLICVLFVQVIRMTLPEVPALESSRRSLGTMT